MGYKSYNAQDLANFTGRPAASFPTTFITMSAFPQATLLFKMATCLASPDALSDDQKQMVDFAILSFADAIHLDAPYQAAKASPFNSESIGSYSYGKAATAVSKGASTGVFWFDRAVSELSVCDALDGIPMSTGIEIFEYDATTVPGAMRGNSRMLTQHDIAASRRFGYDPTTGSMPGVPVIISENGAGTSGGWVEDPDHPGIYIWED